MADFQHFCSDIFAPLYRVDQRQAGETYLHGLLHCAGRKSIRSLAAAAPAPGRSEQSLQQFIGQSPWDPEPIRQRILANLIGAVQPLAWVVQEVAFPKHGRYSAAVDRQYVRSMGRVCNCQLAISVVLTDAEFSVPVNWRLMVPDSWARDEERRARARMPECEHPRPYWQYQIEVLDDMAREWGLLSAPVLIDARNRAEVEAFLDALDQRRHPYVVQVSPSFAAAYDGPQVRPFQHGIGLSRNGTAGCAPACAPVDDLVRKCPNPVRNTVDWQHEDGGVLRSQFIRLPIRPAPVDATGPRPPVGAPPRLLVSEWPFGKNRPVDYWVTNVTDRPLGELVALAKHQLCVGPRIEQLGDRFGLRDYEGRTFAGWHHHVTLATAAFAYHVLERIALSDRRAEVVHAA
jgi:SRSO17 transposase